MISEALAITEGPHLAHVELNRPDKANAFDGTIWTNLRQCFTRLDTSATRVAVLSGRGNHFTAGLDLSYLATIQSELSALPAAERQFRLLDLISQMQSAVTAIETCRKPILAAVHGACLGAGIDLITACDVRYATRDARFAVKEVDLAIVADLGTLQRLPRIVGEGLARELAYTGRQFDGDEALAMGLVSRVFPDRDSMMAHVMETAAIIAAKSPRTIRGIKQVLNYSRDHTVAEGLAYVAERNAAELFSPDLAEAQAAMQEKRTPDFPD